MRSVRATAAIWLSLFSGNGLRRILARPGGAGLVPSRIRLTFFVHFLKIRIFSGKINLFRQRLAGFPRIPQNRFLKDSTAPNRL